MLPPTLKTSTPPSSRNRPKGTPACRPFPLSHPAWFHMLAVQLVIVLTTAAFISPGHIQTPGMTEGN